MLYLSRFRNDENNVLNIILNFSESAGLMANEKPLLEAKYMYMSCLRGGDTSMAGMAIAIPGVLNISKTGDTMGKIR